jgi:O-antigen/teichoic acid export membrane protein
MAIYGVASIAVRWLSITALLLTSKGVDGVIIGWIAGDTALLLMQTFRVTRLVGFKKQDFKAFGKSATTLLKFAFPLYIASAVSFLYTWYDKAVILAYLPLSDLGIYNTTYLAFTVLVTIATALGSALLPYYGMAYGRNDHRAISLGIKRAIKYTALVVFPLALGLAATSKTTLAIFAGQQYQAGWTVLTILSLFGLTYGIAPALSNVLLIYGKTKTILLLSLVPVVSSLTLLPLVWVYGLSGLAIMRGISLALSFILTAYFTNKTAKIQIDRPALSRALVASATMAAAILVLQQAFYSSYLVPVYIIVGAIIYVALIRLLRALDQEDFQLLNQVIGKKATKYVMKILGYTHTP